MKFPEQFPHDIEKQLHTATCSIVMATPSGRVLGCTIQASIAYSMSRKDQRVLHSATIVLPMPEVEAHKIGETQMSYKWSTLVIAFNYGEFMMRQSSIGANGKGTSGNTNHYCYCDECKANVDKILEFEFGHADITFEGLYKMVELLLADKLKDPRDYVKNMTKGSMN